MQLVPITTKVVTSNPAHGRLYSIQLYMIKFVSNLQKVSGTPVSSTNKTDSQYIAEILLKVVLNTIKLTEIHYTVSYNRIGNCAAI